MAMDFHIALWPISVILIGFMIWGVYSLRKSGQLFTPIPMAMLLVILLGWLFIAIFATTFWADPSVDTPESVAPYTNILGVAGSVLLLLGLGLVYRAKGMRLPVLAIFLLGFWFNFANFFVAVMAVSGLWL